MNKRTKITNKFLDAFAEHIAPIVQSVDKYDYRSYSKRLYDAMIASEVPKNNLKNKLTQFIEEIKFKIDNALPKTRASTQSKEM